MKMKINKACDLSSISVLPPPTRRSINNASCSGLDQSSSMIFGKSQTAMSQIRPLQQQSQQSFSQGISSQLGAFSQFSQNSQDETLTNDLQIASQERENSAKRFSSLPPVTYLREESRMPMSRSCRNMMRKWSSAVPEQRCQVNEEVEQRIGTIETSLSRLGLILESIQGDIMQVNKGTKEIALEMESIRQKLIVYDNSLQTLSKGHEDVKASLEGGLKIFSDQLSQNMCQQSSKEISLSISALPQKIEEFILKLYKDLSRTFANELQAMACTLKTSNQGYQNPTLLQRKAVSSRSTPQQALPLKNPVREPKVQPATRTPKIEMGVWNTVKRKQATRLTDKDVNKQNEQKGTTNMEPGREQRIVIDSDEEIDGGFSFLIGERERGIYSIDTTKDETERILRKARRRKRKHCNTIIIN